MITKFPNTMSSGKFFTIIFSFPRSSVTVYGYKFPHSHVKREDQYDFSDGLARGLGYPVIRVREMKDGAGRVGSGRLVCVTNLWDPSVQWRDTMGSGSPEMESLPLDDDEFGNSQHSSQGRSEDNSFWILFEDWVPHFSTLHVCSLVQHN